MDDEHLQANGQNIVDAAELLKSALFTMLDYKNGRYHEDWNVIRSLIKDVEIEFGLE